LKEEEKERVGLDIRAPRVEQQGTGTEVQKDAKKAEKKSP